MLSLVQTFWGTDLPLIQEVARLAVLWRSSSGAAATPEVMILNGGQWASASFRPGNGLVSTTAITSASYNANRGTLQLDIDGVAKRLLRFDLDGLASAPGVSLSAQASSTTLWLERSAFSGKAMTVHRSGDLLFLAPRIGSGLMVYDAGLASPMPLNAHVATPGLALEGISAMTSLTLGGKRWLVTASQTRDMLTLFEIGTGGRLAPIAVLGTAQLLPIDLPSQLVAVTLHGQGFLLLASQGSSSLTVLRLDVEGKLSFVSQVIDNLLTRFGGASALDALHYDGKVLVAIAGRDGGVTLFQLLPTGQLILLHTLEDGHDTALTQMVELRFVVVGTQIELYALAAGDKGLTRLKLDGERLSGGGGGITTVGTKGTAGHDILIAPQGGARLEGGAGDDILVTANGRDTLVGGAGEDLFVVLPDQIGRDSIADFTPGEDRIDLSAFLKGRSLSAWTITSNKTGAVLRLGDTEITLVAGRSLVISEVTAAILLNTDRVLISQPLPQSAPPPATPISGTEAEGFVFAGQPGARSYHGGTARDEVSYAASKTAIGLHLSDQTKNSGAALGHVLVSIEAIIGTRYADHISGGGGNDRLEGRAGADWLTPGPGNDTLDGGPGSDMVSYIDLEHPMRIDLQAGRTEATDKSDQLRLIENVTGTIWPDLITGNTGHNLLRGMGGYDWFVASAGNDTFDGGSGRDMVSYISASSGVSVNLGLGRGLSGQAAGDQYLSIERLTGSSFADVFYGSPGEDEFRGMAGNDLFHASAARDRYDGGHGFDTVSYADAPGAVSASLLLGRGLSGLASRDLYVSVEALIGSKLPDHLTGDHLSNLLSGGGGNDSLYGNGGNDSLLGGAGNDLLNGGIGWDTAHYAGTRADYRITGTRAGATVQHLFFGPAHEGLDHLIDVEALFFADGSLLL